LSVPTGIIIITKRIICFRKKKKNKQSNLNMENMKPIFSYFGLQLNLTQRAATPLKGRDNKIQFKIPVGVVTGNKRGTSYLRLFVLFDFI
jgi:hypothetical protein